MELRFAAPEKRLEAVEVGGLDERRGVFAIGTCGGVSSFLGAWNGLVEEKGGLPQQQGSIP